MIREIINPKTNQVVINIPPNMVNQKLELLLFPIKDTATPLKKKKAKQLMDKVFKNAESTTIQKNIDIDEIMNDMIDFYPF
jgi:hypothetical protein